MGHLGEIQFSFPFPSLPLDYFDIQDLKILLGFISFEIIVANSQHYGLKCKPDAWSYIEKLWILNIL